MIKIRLIKPSADGNGFFAADGFVMDTYCFSKIGVPREKEVVIFV